MTDFCKIKQKKLTSTDLSKKASIDEPIRNIIEFINSKEQFVTTSSCSGRIIVLSQPTNGCGNSKQGCNWIFTSHELIEGHELVEALSKDYPNAVFKFEPFILHVQCRSLNDAQKLHLTAIESGFRNSGISLSKKGKVMVAVRNTHGLEVPLAYDHKVLVSSEYLHFLAKKANEKMVENECRFKRFFIRIQEVF